MAVSTIEQTGDVPEADESPEAEPARIDPYPWRRALVWSAIAYVLSRAAVLAGAGAAGAAANPRPDNGTGPILDVLTGWDGKWYFAVARTGYPHHIPPHITFNQPEARAAFFPLYPRVVWAVNKVLPGGDVLAALGLNLLFGAIFILLVGLMTRRFYGNKAAARAMVLTALFPGSFVLSYAYSEALMLVLCAGCLLLLMDRRWLWAGVLAGLATASRPNAPPIIASCAVAALVAIVQRREWRSLIAPLLAPIGWLSFQLFLWHQTGERKAWFRVQREAWTEGTSFGLTAIKDIGNATLHPLDSPANILTLLCVAAMLFGLWALWKRPLPLPVIVYTIGVLALMLLPKTVTARPRFLFTAFPLIIAIAAWWPKDDDEAWPLLLAVCGAGLVAVTALYGVLGAIP
jgi:hypothetical protein